MPDQRQWSRPILWSELTTRCVVSIGRRRSWPKCKRCSCAPLASSAIGVLTCPKVCVIALQPSSKKLGCLLRKPPSSRNSSPWEVRNGSVCRMRAFPPDLCSPSRWAISDETNILIRSAADPRYQRGFDESLGLFDDFLNVPHRRQELPH